MAPSWSTADGLEGALGQDSVSLPSEVLMKLIAVLLRLASIKTYLPGVSGTAKVADENGAVAANGVANKISTANM
jgi:hypothetical protein